MGWEFCWDPRSDSEELRFPDDADGIRYSTTVERNERSYDKKEFPNSHDSLSAPVGALSNKSGMSRVTDPKDLDFFLKAGW